MIESRLEEFDGAQWVDIGPGDIDSIELFTPGTPVANINLSIAPDPAEPTHLVGARDVRAIDLSFSGASFPQTSVSGGFGANGITSGSVGNVGTLAVGKLEGDFSVGTAGSIVAGQVLSSLNVGNGTSVQITNGGAGDLSFGAVDEVTIGGTHVGDLFASGVDELTLGEFVGFLNLQNVGEVNITTLNGQVFTNTVNDSLTIGTLNATDFCSFGSNLNGALSIDKHTGARLDIFGVKAASSVHIGETRGFVAVFSDVLGVFTADNIIEGSISIASLVGNCTVLRVNDAELAIGDLSGTLNITEQLSDAEVNLGVVSGTAAIAPLLPAASLVTATTVTASGELVCSDDVEAPIIVFEDLDGLIRIDGSVNGVGSIAVLGGLPTGNVTVLNQTGALGGGVNDFPFFSVNADGDPGASGTSWNAPTTAVWGNTTYTSPNPVAGLWEVTTCIGDMNNDGTVNAGDLDGFIAVITNAGDPMDSPDITHPYFKSFPGLWYARTYKADTNLDGRANAGDLDSFTAAVVSSSCVTPSAGPAGLSGAGFAGASSTPTSSPADMAALLVQNTDPARHALLTKVTTDAAAIADTAERQAYWFAVTAELFGK